jgi:hypothetical protein
MAQKTEVKTDDILAVGNRYLDNEQQRVYAIQWREQYFYQLFCGAQPFIKINNVEYRSKSVTSEEENKVKVAALVLDKCQTLFDMEIQKLQKDTNKDIDLNALNENISKIREILGEADRKFIATCAEAYYGMNEDTANKNKEAITPYVLGRSFLHNIKVIGNNFEDPKIRNALLKFVSQVTERRY